MKRWMRFALGGSLALVAFGTLLPGRADATQLGTDNV